jgi:hypothetical protein
MLDEIENNIINSIEEHVKHIPINKILKKFKKVSEYVQRKVKEKALAALNKLESKINNLSNNEVLVWSIFAVFVFLGVAAACILVFKAYKAKKNRSQPGQNQGIRQKRLKWWKLTNGRPESDVEMNQLKSSSVLPNQKGCEDKKAVSQNFKAY